MLLRPIVRIVTLAAAVLLITTVALADLRSPEGTAELGRRLADDEAVQALVSMAVVDALLEDASTAAPDAALLLPLVRPALASAVDATLATPAGRAALATALTDLFRQATFDGPLILDLRTAVLAAADAAPEPLATLARTAVERGAVGVVVLGASGDEGQGDLLASSRSDVELARVAGLPTRTATTIAWAVLVGVLAAGLLPAGRGRAPRMRAAGTSLLLVGAPVLLLLRAAPRLLVDRIAPLLSGVSTSTGPSTDVTPVAAVLPTLTDGITGLLERTGDVALGVTGLGAALLVIGLVVGMLPGRR